MSAPKIPTGWTPIAELPGHRNNVLVAMYSGEVWYVVACYDKPYWVWGHPFDFPDEFAIAWREIPDPIQ